MKPVILFLFFLLSLPLSSQNKNAGTITIQKKKEFPQVTLGGVSEGNCSKLKVFGDPRIRLTNNSGNYKVISFVISMKTTSGIIDLPNRSDSLSILARNEFIKLSPDQKPRVIIEQVVLAGPSNDTIRVPGIVVQLIE